MLWYFICLTIFFFSALISCIRPKNSPSAISYQTQVLKNDWLRIFQNVRLGNMSFDVKFGNIYHNDFISNQNNNADDPITDLNNTAHKIGRTCNSDHLFSIIVSTYNRKRCLERVVNRLLEFLPKCTEIVIVDDNSNEPDKKEYLRNIEQNHKNIRIFINPESYGAYHTKMRGFREARGQYLMSIDDDDTFDDLYYQEIVYNIDDRFDFIVPRHNFMIRYFDINKFTTLEQIIKDFHNHVAFAFRRSLLDIVGNLSVKTCVVRDDAVIAIPMYIQSSFNKFLFFENKAQYRLDRFCSAVHESNKYRMKRHCVRNGFEFLKSEIERLNYTKYLPYVEGAYKGFM
ncbi:hypothetical protein TRFO_01781 [Tritrichomonas foetus]|uniref:Glycosyltransferase 2-like domain-containing protein n=1 Tax=Tritrichomonas foetus TaxID=1144522 RepID=A0A1J4JPS6_9EUKA|nr:hypothetical protein TRFO_01781 [Tritrichomonas foetus]|eukprot:OHT01159.1 hypothetical protein TRFO_01781 [Tritrichomonas foetus]